MCSARFGQSRQSVLTFRTYPIILSTVQSHDDDDGDGSYALPLDGWMDDGSSLTLMERFGCGVPAQRTSRSG